MSNADRGNAIAIVGMGGRFPGANDLGGFWRNIRGGVESLEAFSDADLDAARVDASVRRNPRYVRKGTVLDGVDLFDASFFGYSPREAQVLDPQQRIFLETAYEAVEHAGYAGAIAGQSVGVYAGVGMNVYLLSQLLANPSFISAVGGYQLMLGNDKDFLATRVSYKLDLRGPSVSVQTACSTSLVAVVMACRALHRGECDMALAGGVSIVLPQRGGYLFEEGMIFSPDGHCRPFDERAQGTRGGSGAGVVVLKRLANAVADRDTIHAVILGAAMNNDGAGKAGYTAPSIEGQIEVIATAQALAGVDPRSIEYVEAHGTATPLGDPIEIAALTQAFRASTTDVGFCRLGALKANLGHLDAAAGVAGLIKTVMALEHAEFPPLVNFTRANPRLALDTSPFVASAVGGAWPAGATPRRAGVSSFGIGGTNAHVVLEEAPAATQTRDVRGAHLLVWSARTETALDRMTDNFRTYLETTSDVSMTDVAYTLEVGRQVFAHRRAVVVRDREQAMDVLSVDRRSQLLTAIYEGGPRSVAFLFSGQGSQYAGMGAELYRTERIYREAFDRCAGILLPHLGSDLRDIVFAAAGDPTINETRFTQPALFAFEYALASLWMSRGVTPSAMLGHSIGEYVAAHLAGVFTLDDALAMVAARGRLMQELPAGSMAAVGLPSAEVERLAREFAGVEVAASNAPNLTTVSGPGAAVAALGERIGTIGGDFRPLHTSHAFHSSMMEPALEPFAELLRGITLSAPRIPYVSNLTGTWISDSEATSPEYYARHLRHAVQFADGVRAVAADPSVLLLEVGPGNALASLARLTLGKDGAKRVVSSLAHVKEQRSEVEAVLEATGRLWLAGGEIDWQSFHADAAPRRVPLPTYPFERQRHWVDAPAPTVATPATQTPPTRSIEESFFAPTWTRDDSAVDTPRLAGPWLVLANHGPLADAVTSRVQAAGATPVLVVPGDAFAQLSETRFSVRPAVSDDFAEVVRRVRDMGTPVSGAIHMWTVDVDDDSNHTLSYHSQVALATALAPSYGGEARIVVVTSGLASVLDEPVHAPARAIALGPVLSLPLEMPGLRIRLVDIPRHPDTAHEADGGGSASAQFLDAIILEAANTDSENVIAHRAGRRWVRRFEPISIVRTPIAPTENGVYLITGGLGGIGLSVARWLAAHTRARLLLTARTPLPPREQWNTWRTADDRTGVAIRAVEELERSGSEVIVAAADAADEAAMRRAIDAARERWGAINGVVHAAGVPGSGRIAILKEPDEVQGVLAPKVTGLAVLSKLLGSSPLDFVVLLSSINSLMGAPGLSDYSAANAVFDAFPGSSARPSAWKRVVTINYGPWRDVGMAARLFEGNDGKRDDTFRHVSISPETGTEAFGRALGSGREQVVVFPQDLPLVMALLRANGGAPPATTSAPKATTMEAPDKKPAVLAANDTERRVAEIWSELLGLERIGMDDDFFELGGHSLLATRVLARIDQSLGARLTLRDVFDAPTVRRLAARIAAVAPASAESDREELEF